VVGGDMRQLLMSGGAGTEPGGLGWPELLRRPRLFRHGGDEIAEVIARTCAQGLVCVCVCVCVCVICVLARGCTVGRRCLTGPWVDS
jgi:hypothetical protein